MDDNRIDTGGGSVTGGGVDTGGGRFTGRDVNEKSIDGGVVVNINQPEIGERHHNRRELMPSVEQELRGDLKSLTVAVIKLEATVDKNSTVTAEQIKSVREQGESLRLQSQALEKKMEERLAGVNLVVPSGQFPRWTGYLTLILLTIIALSALYVVFYVTRGGF